MDDVRGFLRRFGPNVVCLSCTITECIPAIVELVRLLKVESPHLRIYAGGNAALAHAAELLAAGCSQICAGRSEALRAIRRYALQRRFRSADSSSPMAPDSLPALPAQDSTVPPAGTFRPVL